MDDVINVAGHRLGTKELESACLTVTEVAEAAVVPVVDEIKGRVPEIYIALKPGYAPTKEITDRVIATIETMIGKIARPRQVHIVPDMPKTRSGKIMRRVLAAISNTLDTGRHHHAGQSRHRRADSPARAGQGEGCRQGRSGRPQAVR